MWTLASKYVLEVTYGARLPGESNSHPAIQKCPYILWTVIVRHSVNKSLSLVPTIGQMNPINIHPVLNVQFSIILPINSPLFQGVSFY